MRATEKDNPPSLTINEAFQRTADIFEKSDRSVFVTGRAGTGKSTLLRWLCSRSKKRPVVLAPTGIAALLVGGQTIHSFFRFNSNITPEDAKGQRIYDKKRKPLYKKLRLLVIDEASMLRADLLDCMDVFLRRHGPDTSKPFGGVQMAFFGDLGQLPPVVTEVEKEAFSMLYRTPYFFSSPAMSELSTEIVELTHVYRQQDSEFINLLNRIRDGHLTDEDLRQLNSRHQPNPPDDGNITTLTATNRVADALNEKRLQALPGDIRETEAELRGEFPESYSPTARTLRLKRGALVMLLNNDRDGQWVNGSRGIVQGLQNDANGEERLIVRLTENRRTVHVPRHNWDMFRYTLKDNAIVAEEIGAFRQYPARLAWAITIHKSQGQTFDQMILDVGSGLFAHGQAYVALSRCTTLGGITLKRPLTADDICTDTEIRHAMSDWRRQQAETALPLARRLRIIRQAIKEEQPLTLSYIRRDHSHEHCLVTPLALSKGRYQGIEFHGLKARYNDNERLFRIDHILSIDHVVAATE